MLELPERHLQRAVWQLLSDPARVWQTLSGKRLQVLAPGELNVYEGPDFRDMVLLLEGTILVGDGEFHRTAREWLRHGHPQDPRYARVLLHIVTNPGGIPPGGMPEVLVIPEAELTAILHTLAAQETPTEALVSLQELQYFALLRLLRHTVQVRQYTQQWEFPESFQRLLMSFFERYLRKRRRPVHTSRTLQALLEAFPSSALMEFLQAFHRGSAHPLTLRLYELGQRRIATEGAHLRMEILLNCVVPYILAHATADQRVEILSWYWSAPARVRYGQLQRRFPGFPQRYMWQQQGMLEFLRQSGSGLLCRELLLSYRFGDLLEFYQTAERLLGY
ncbi:hypothetical protein HRbin21_00373 [bacterium HR21]|jgi:hypothetical protein|nr:hypothetical protein HRbin21_00373 [bacterium HR21]